VRYFFRDSVLYFVICYGWFVRDVLFKLVFREFVFLSLVRHVVLSVMFYLRWPFLLYLMCDFIRSVCSSLFLYEVISYALSFVFCLGVSLFHYFFMPLFDCFVRALLCMSFVSLSVCLLCISCFLYVVMSFIHDAALLLCM